MKIAILDLQKIKYFELPSKIDGSFLVCDEQNDDEVLFSIEAVDNNWVIVSTDETQIIDGNNFTQYMQLIPNNFYRIKCEKDIKIVYAMEMYDNTFSSYKISNNLGFSIGKDQNSDIIYNNPYILNQHAVFKYSEGKWNIQISKESLVYLNNIRLNTLNTELQNGDFIFIYGIKIILINDLVVINNPNNSLIFKNLRLKPFVIEQSQIDYEEVKEKDYYTEDDYFFKTPRLRRFVETYETTIVPPPAKQDMEEMPLFLVVGPMLTMGISSVVTLLNLVIRITNGETTLKDSWATLIICFVMLASILLWPNLTRNYQNKQKNKKEKKRKEKYREYIERKRKLLQEQINEQSIILHENLISLDECYNTIIEKRRTLWERKTTHKDFLEIRVGIGDVPLDADINFSEDEFILEEDEIKTEATNLVHETRMLRNVPVGYSFFNRKATAIMGINKLMNPFIKSVILQLITYHSYDDLKIVVLTNKKNKHLWEYCKMLPHCFSNNKEIRFFSDEIEDAKVISSYLEKEFIKRVTEQAKADEVETEVKETTFLPYYIIITDDFTKMRRLGISEMILKTKGNFGFSFIIPENRLGKLPSECVDFINIGNNKISIIRNDLDETYEKTAISELNYKIDIDKCCEVLANIPIEFYEDLRSLPTTLGFLEMYGVGKVEQLNIYNRWKLNDPTRSLRAQIGVNDKSSKVYLDLHEKYHGPHGLIAGTTGSGKSEFIITYILSMCINYSPNEVAFILIDYKGGGLAGAFENKKKKIKLPHLSGTITNLDKSELNRTLVSIESELKRRQALFNKARDELGESTIDIYKYQKFFREGKLSEPCPHLFIISDEFAELKAQQPDFMDNLVSAARIGRSLGVHLILATQKPSGVVNDQIWSNSKFKVCLKVQEKSDSNEIIKRPDAADLKDPGRFYLQVGYNELFMLGQSGWCGTQYIPSDIASKKVDRSISFIDDMARIYKTSQEENKNKFVENLGDELSNVLENITKVATRENIYAKSLWLDSIPADIYVDNLLNKYNYQPNKNQVEAILGEYDDPSNQYQGLVKLKLDAEGNTIIYSQSSAGREMIINSLIYSLCLLYKTEDINIYIFDFGSEALRMFDKMPQVGDIVYSEDSEKIEKLLGIIDDEIETRKELFVDYNGEYETYCKNSGNKLPLKIVIFNNFESFKESYGNYEDLISRYAREGKRYGIIIIVATVSSSGMFGKFIRNFKNVFALDMGDRNGYSNYFDRVGNLLPASFVGRGMFKGEKLYEFQSAQICPKDNLLDFVKARTLEIQKYNSTKAPKIPILPEKVTFDMLESYIKDLKNVPLGIGKVDLNVSTYNFMSDKATLITGNNSEVFPDFIKNLVLEFNSLKTINTILIDADNVFEKYKDIPTNYRDSNFENYLQDASIYIDDTISNSNVELMVIFVGLEKFVSKVNNNVIDDFCNHVRNIDNVHMIFIDTSYKIKKFVFESWYTNNIVNADGIWLGNGVFDQTIIKMSELSAKYKEKVNDDYAWIFKNGNGSLIKIINSDGDNNE